MEDFENGTSYLHTLPLFSFHPYPKMLTCWLTLCSSNGTSSMYDILPLNLLSIHILKLLAGLYLNSIMKYVIPWDIFYLLRYISLVA